MKRYFGERTPERGCEVLVVAGGFKRFLKPEKSLKLRNHSPTGFEWGYCGSGPAQLALALLLDATKDEKTALNYYQDFKFMHVSGWGAKWAVTDEQIVNWVQTFQAGEGGPRP